MHARTMVTAIVAILALLIGTYMVFIAPRDVLEPVAEVPLQPEGWTRVTSSQGISYAYPADLEARFLSESEWPPQIAVGTLPYACAPGTASPGSFVEERAINGRTYCVSSNGEGAAGSTYVTYDYLTAKEEATLRTTFTVRMPQCLNYDEPDRAACQAEQLSFNPDALASGIIESVQLP